MTTRRDFIAGAGRLLGGTALLRAGSGLAELSSDTSVTDDLLFAPVGVLAGSIRNRKVSSRELVTAYLERIDRIDPWLNAVVTLADETALARARQADAMLARGDSMGPLHGVPMTIKDSLDTRGIVTTWGVPERHQFVPNNDATVVARLHAAGAILLGKTNTPELTLSFETNSPIHGPTNNPYDVTRTAGGSSGGAAAIVAAGGSPFDIGSDTGGSIRLPAHFCGVAGIRPTSARVPRTGNAIPPGGPLDRLTAIGPITRYCEDLTLLLSIVSGPDRRDGGTALMPVIDPRRIKLPRLRASFHTDNGIRTPTRATIDTVRRVVDVLSDAGVIFEERIPPAIGTTLELFTGLLKRNERAWRQAPRARATVDRGNQRTVATQPDGVKNSVLMKNWDGFRSRMREFMAPYDLLVCPVNALPALPHGQAVDQIDAFSYTMTYSLTDWPAAVVRAGTSPEGLPIGVQIIAAPRREDLVLAAACHVEKSLGGWQAPTI